MFEIVVENVTSKVRLDKYLELTLCELGHDTSRSLIQKNIEFITLNGSKVKKNTSVNNGDLIVYRPPPPKEISLEPENIPIDIVYQDKDIVVINKALGMVVHPAKGNYSGTLVNALLYHIKDFDAISGTVRPGIVHRLDKDTSGLMVVAKNDASFNHLADQFKNREVNKIYHCLVKGVVRFEQKTIENNIGRHPHHRKKFAVTENGKPSKTKFEKLKVMGGCTLLKVKIYTGRTHQIRVHTSHLGYPILGDVIYSRSSKEFEDGLALFSKELSFIHPSHGHLVSFDLDYPQHFKCIMSKLSNNFL